MFRRTSKYRPHHSTTPVCCQQQAETVPGRFSQSRAKRHFRRMEVLHIRPRRFFENKGFCGFAKQNARMQRASRPLPEAGAVLRSKMPACSGQAAENCLDRGTQANLSGGTKRLCPAILDAEDGKVPPIAAVRLAAGGWPHAAPKPYGHTLLPSRPSAALAAGPCLEHSRKEGQRRGGKWLCAPLRECEKCTRGPCWGRGCGRAEHRRHSARLYTISCCVLTDSHTTNIVFTMAHT